MTQGKACLRDALNSSGKFAATKDSCQKIIMRNHFYLLNQHSKLAANTNTKCPKDKFTLGWGSSLNNEDPLFFKLFNGFFRRTKLL